MIAFILYHVFSTSGILGRNNGGRAAVSHYQAAAYEVALGRITGVCGDPVLTDRFF